MAGKSRTAVVVISPARTTSPVVSSVSTATRDPGSEASAASTIASEIWSATLSGWPSVTDSEVNRKPSLMSCRLLGGLMGQVLIRAGLVRGRLLWARLLRAGQLRAGLLRGRLLRGQP